MNPAERNSAANAALRLVQLPPRLAPKPIRRLRRVDQLDRGRRRRALEGERKTVTALFADIKGSTELMEDLDPEEARAIIDPALKLMIDAVHRYDGYVVQSTGDGIFALFGAPVAHEDHPQRALYAALRMQEELQTLLGQSACRGRHCRSRRASASTPAKWWCVRSQPAAGQTEYTPIGHTTNLASRMQTARADRFDRGQRSDAQAVRRLFHLQGAGPDQGQRASASRSTSTR